MEEENKQTKHRKNEKTTDELKCTYRNTGERQGEIR